MHVSQVHESDGAANFFIKSWSTLTTGFDVLLPSLLSILISHDPDPAGGTNFFIKSLFEGGCFLGVSFPVDGLDD